MEHSALGLRRPPAISDQWPFVLQYLVCKRKLESKKEALLILSKELDTCQQERDQYKLMANQLRERHQSLKKKYRELIVSLALSAKTGEGAVVISSFQKPPLANSSLGSLVYAWNPSFGGRSGIQGLPWLPSG